MARLYTNENFPYPAVEHLRRFGHDVLTTRDSGQAGKAIPDDQVLLFASSENRILVTLNRKHFIQLHIINPAHSGIIVCTFDPDFYALAHHVHSLLNESPNAEGKLLRVNRERI